jgi:hypothetical protein
MKNIESVNYIIIFLSLYSILELDLFQIIPHGLKYNTSIVM